MNAERFRLEDKGPVLGPGGLHLGGCLLLIFGIIVGSMLWKRADQFPDPQLARQIIIGGMMLCVVPMLITAIQVIRLRRSLGTAQLELPHHELPLGFSGTLTYARPLRHGASVGGIDARLQCQEVLISGGGKNKSVRRELIFDEPVPATTTPGLDEMRVQIPVRIPATGPHSLDFRDIRVEWWLRLKLTMNGVPNTRSSFQLAVLPEIVER